MKKVLVIFLALVTLLSVALVACNDSGSNNGGSSGNNGGDDNDFVVQTKKDTSDTNSDTTGTGNNGSNGWTTFSTPKTIYAMWDIYIRKEPSTSPDNTDGKVSVKTSLTAVAKNDTWYKIDYNGNERYVSADWVTDSIDEVTFTALSADKQFDITVKAAPEGTSAYTVYLRKYQSWAEEAKSIVMTKEKTDEEALKVVEKNAKGNWYIVSYKGDRYYLPYTSANSQYLEGTGLSSSESNGGIIIGG